MEMGCSTAHLSLLPIFLNESAPNLTHLYLTKLHLGGRTTFPEDCKFPALKHLHISRVRADRLVLLSRRCPARISLVCQDYYLPYDDPDDGLGVHPEEAPPRNSGLNDQALVFTLLNFGRLEKVTLSQNSVRKAFKQPDSIVLLPSVKTVTLIGNASLPQFYEKTFHQSTFDHFLQTFTSLNHLILYDVSMLWPLDAKQQHHFKASLQGIQHINFEGAIRLTPIHAALKLLPNLRSVKFEACHPSFTHGDFLRDSNLGSSSVFEPESLKGEGPRAREPIYPDRLAVEIANFLLTEESPIGQGVPCRSTLQCLGFSGLTIMDVDIRYLLKFLKPHQEHQEVGHRDTGTHSYSALLTIKDCFYTAIRSRYRLGDEILDLGHRSSRIPVRDAENMGYNEAEELFKCLPEQFENRVDEEDEGDEEDGENDGADSEEEGYMSL